ncbi:hypothetical protein [Nonomuraea sp. NPDC002799]
MAVSEGVGYFSGTREFLRFPDAHPPHAADAGPAAGVVGHAMEHLARFKIPAYVKFGGGFSLTPSAASRSATSSCRSTAPTISVDKERT